MAQANQQWEELVSEAKPYDIPSGYKRAVVAVAHKILVAIYHALSGDTPYRELGADYL